VKETRAEKAQRLVDGEHVHLTGRGTFFQNAQVYSGWNIYFLTLYTNGHFHCTCNYGSYHSHTDDLCAHALAVKLMTEKEKKPC